MSVQPQTPKTVTRPAYGTVVPAASSEPSGPAARVAPQPAAAGAPADQDAAVAAGVRIVAVGTLVRLMVAPAVKCGIW